MGSPSEENERLDLYHFLGDVFLTHPKLSRHSTAIEHSLKASSRRVLPALQAESGCSDSQKMAGAVDVETRGAIEASERDGGADQADSAGTQGVVWGHTAFPEGKAVEKMGLQRAYHSLLF
jgi:hypothetical protein